MGIFRVSIPENCFEGVGGGPTPCLRPLLPLPLFHCYLRRVEMEFQKLENQSKY